MEIFFMIVVTISILVMLCCIWALYCNEKTYRQRSTMLTKIFKKDNYEDLLDEYHEVSYFEHVTALILFKNAHNLYSSKIRDLY